jgi:hypothetical protein
MKLKGATAWAIGRQLRGYGDRRVVLDFPCKEERRGPPLGWIGKVLVEARALSDYFKATGSKTLDRSRYEITNEICQTDIKRLSLLANSPGKGWLDNLEDATPYSFSRNISSLLK